MGRRSVPEVKASGLRLNVDAVGIVVAALGFALEVAMIAAFLYWGFRQASPWNLVLGIGIPAAIVVLWGIFMASRSDRRLPVGIVQWAALAMFVLAGVVLILAGQMVLGLIMVVLALVYFIADRLLARN